MAEGIQESGMIREVPASEILAQIEKGEPVQYDSVIIMGKLDATTLELPKDDDERMVIAQTIWVENSRFDDMVIFKNMKFEDVVSFCGTQFGGKEMKMMHGVFLGAYSADFTGSIFGQGANFNETEFDGKATFYGVHFEFVIGFNEARFNGEVNFDEVRFPPVGFNRTRFNEDASFFGAQFDRLHAEEAHFIKDADFHGARFRSDIHFTGSQFQGITDFSRSVFREEANFRGSYFADVSFNGAQFDGEVLTFRDAIFENPRSQEDACRRAKNLLAKRGDRDEEGYHFYREMEAKRKQKPWYYRYPEHIFMQKIFGYGVHPFWLFCWWLAIVLVFAVIYSIWSGIEQPEAKQWYDYFWFSVATAATPGYALYRPIGWFKFIASIEAILGTFMWAAFITIFARKFMR